MKKETCESRAALVGLVEARVDHAGSNAVKLFIVLSSLQGSRLTPVYIVPS